jgi:hypothetical protein
MNKGEYEKVSEIVLKLFKGVDDLVDRLNKLELEMMYLREMVEAKNEK